MRRRHRYTTLVPYILVVEDDPAVRELVMVTLEADGYDVSTAPDAAGARRLMAIRHFDLAVLDVMMPGASGHELLAEIRHKADLPVIMLTAVVSESSKLLAFGLGADDYVTKPFSPVELSARIEAVLRRSAGGAAAAAAPAPPRVIEVDGLRIDIDGRTVHRAGREAPMELTAREFELLLHLALHPGRVFTRGELLSAVWHSSAEWQQEATVTEHVRRLRQKIEEDPDRPRWLQTVRGVGYRFERRATARTPARR